MSATLPNQAAPIAPEYAVRMDTTAFSTTTYTVSADLADGVAKYIRTTNHRLATHNTPGFSWSAYRHVDPDTGEDLVTFEIRCPELVHEHWRFIAKAEKGVFTRVTNGHPAHSLPKPDQDCAHCNTVKRRSKKTYLQHVETGEIIQVGSECIRLFFEADPVGLLIAWDFVPKPAKLTKIEHRALSPNNLFAWMLEHLSIFPDPTYSTSELAGMATEWIVQQLRARRNQTSLPVRSRLFHPRDLLSTGACPDPERFLTAFTTPLTYPDALDYLAGLRDGYIAAAILNGNGNDRPATARYLGEPGDQFPISRPSFRIDTVITNPDTGMTTFRGAYTMPLAFVYLADDVLEGHYRPLAGAYAEWTVPTDSYNHRQLRDASIIDTYPSGVSGNIADQYLPTVIGHACDLATRHTVTVLHVTHMANGTI